MKPTTKQMVAMLALLAVSVAPGVASAGSATAYDATLYELTENMKLVPRHDRSSPRAKRVPTSARRVATAALAGYAKPGTPLCPADPGEPDCMVHVHGSDNISLTTGLGTLQGQFSTVIQGDNPVDGPEAVMLRGEFRGHMDFSPAILHQIPYGTVTGKVQVTGSREPSDFTGVFRLPFDGNVETEVEVMPGVTITLTLRQIFCPATPDPNPYAEFYGDDIKLVYLDLVYLDNVEEARTEKGRCLNIQPNELSLGAPLVRFDVKF
jgi:hypothetical protein